jgi:serine/threonine-protein kinase
MPEAASFASSELVLGRYRPLRPLGSGGSGSVWLALDTESGSEVALKIVAREGKAGSRAEREASAAARLRHPHCQRALGFASDDENVYIAYEYAAGQTLRSALRAGELDDRSAVEAARQIADALAHAHGEGIVHRDVKPANVLLAESDAVDARLLDFGLAQLAEAETLTAVGDVPGTLAYISPERLANEPAGPAADVWALGVILWEALAGWHPFWAGSLLDTARKISAGAEPLRTQRPDLPKLLLAAVDRALSLDPARRPSAAQLQSALAAAFEERSRQRAPAKKPPRPQLRLRRRMPVSAMLAPAAAGLVAGWTVEAFPFYPGPAFLVATALATALTVFRPRVGLAFTLALPLLPLGNLSIAAAALAACCAIALLAAFWHEPRSGLLFAAGPLLGPIGLLGLVPLLFWRVRNPARRALQAALAVLAAGLIAGMEHAPLPFTGARPELGLGIAGSAEPGAVFTALVNALGRHHELPVEAAVLAAATVLLPYARQLGRWGVAAGCTLLLGASLLLVPEAHALGLVVCAWAIAAVLLRGAPETPELRLPSLRRTVRPAPRPAA